MTFLLAFFRNLFGRATPTKRGFDQLTGPLSNLRLGISWDLAAWTEGNPPVYTDLDAAALMYSAAGDLLDSVTFDQLRSLDGSVVHAGDAVTTEDAGPDDQHFLVHLDAVPADVTTIVFALTAHYGQDLREVTSLTMRLVDDSHGVELAQFTCTDVGGEHTAFLVAKVRRTGRSWSVTVLGTPAEGHLATSLSPAAPL